jgi:hypothetical protein
MQKQFIPNVGKYRKIDVCATTIEDPRRVYLHSTTAYNTLHHAEIGCAIALKKIGGRFYTTVYGNNGYETTPIDPYSIKAFFNKN